MLTFVIVALILVSGNAAKLSSREKRTSPVLITPPNAPGCEPIFPDACEQSPLEISFVVDASSSIGPLNFDRCLNFIEDFVSYFTIDPVRVSFITFAEKADEVNAFGFADHTTLEDLKDTIAHTNYTQFRWTNTSAGLRYMLDNQVPEARSGVRHVAIVITDGRSQETSKTKAAAAAVKAVEGLEVFAIGVGSDVHYPELATIATDGRHIFEAESYEVLHTLTKRLIFVSCDVPTFPECEMDPVELAFVIDSSASIQEDNFTKGMEFVQSFVEHFKVDQQHVRIAAVTFDHNENEDDAIHFDEYADTQGVVKRLKKIKYNAGSYTNTGAGIAFMRDVLMTRARVNTVRVCIVMTDGQSQEPAKTQAEAEAARDAGIVMYAVGVGNGVDDTELENIAGDMKRVLKADDYSTLNVKKDELLNVTCSGILGTYQTQANQTASLYDV